MNSHVKLLFLHGSFIFLPSEWLKLDKLRNDVISFYIAGHKQFSSILYKFLCPKQHHTAVQ